MSAEPPDQRDTSVAVRLKEQVLAEQLALKDRALDVAAEGITIADARLPARPLIYANDGFERLTGYPVGEVVGRNCRFLQGPESDPTAVAEIRAAIAEQRECIVEILNYRRDGSSFWNRLSVTPVRDESGVVTHFIGIQSDVTARREAAPASDDGRATACAFETAEPPGARGQRASSSRRREDRLTIREPSSLEAHGTADRALQLWSARGGKVGVSGRDSLGGQRVRHLRDSPHETPANLPRTGHLRCLSDQPVAEIVQCGEPAP